MKLRCRRRVAAWVENVEAHVQAWEHVVATAPTELIRERAGAVLATERRILAEAKANPDWGGEGNAQERNVLQGHAVRHARWVAPSAELHPMANAYGNCRIGARTRVAAFVEIQAGAVIGADCKVSSHSFICAGVTIADRVFVGHGVMFCNDLHPRATNDAGKLSGAEDWDLVPTTVGRGASIGSGAVILPGAHIGEGAMVGAGSVVVSPVPKDTTVVGNPARALA